MKIQQGVAWFDCDWQYQSIMTITESNGTAITNDKILITLDASDFNSEYTWSASGKDLRVVELDDMTVRPFVIQSWDAVAQIAEIYVDIISLPAGASEQLYLYYGNASASPPPTASIYSVLEPGIRVHTRRSTADPTDQASAYAAFDAGNDTTPGYGCAVINEFDNIRNQVLFGPPNLNNNFGIRITAHHEVQAADVGVWEFRLGGDYGRGGALYVDDLPITERWNEDIWWGLNWGNTDVIQGSVYLTEGYHKFEAIGFEGCCDGENEYQFRKPGGAWQVMSTANLDIRSFPEQLTDGTFCPPTDPIITSTITTEQTDTVSVSLKKTMSVISDPINGMVNPKNIPGARVRYAIEVVNSKGPIDQDSVVISDKISSSSKVYVGAGAVTSADSSPASGLTLSYVSASDAGDDVSFSFDGTNFTYSPVADSDDADEIVMDIRFNPKGQMECIEGNTPGSNSFTIYFDVIQK